MVLQISEVRTMQIGLLAYQKGTWVPYDVLYTFDEVLAHNRKENVVQISREQWMLTKLLERNTLLDKDVNAFQMKYGSAQTKQDRIRASFNPRLYVPNYVAMKHARILDNFKRKVVHLGKVMSGKYMFLLFYAQVLDTHSWKPEAITLVVPGPEDFLAIHIHRKVTKNKLIQYIKDNWEKIEENISSFVGKEDYHACQRDLRIEELRRQGHKYSYIADQIQTEYEDSMSDEEVKTTYARIKSKIEAVYQEFTDTRGATKAIQPCKSSKRNKRTKTTKSPKRNKKR